MKNNLQTISSSAILISDKEGRRRSGKFSISIFDLPGECRLFNLHPLGPGLIATLGNKPFAYAPPEKLHGFAKKVYLFRSSKVYPLSPNIHFSFFWTPYCP
jgi:hypothetical protein